MSDAMPGFTHRNSETIGFVCGCVYSSAIDISELRDWCAYVIDQNDVESIPSYLFDLVDFDQPLSHIYKVIGFVPVWNCTDDEFIALHGIAVLRDRESHDAPVNEQSALERLRENPLIVERFRQTFPFITLSWE